MGADRDPIERALGDSRDLYDIATWDQRTALDDISVRLASFLAASSRMLVYTMGITILFVQIALTGFAVVRSPALGVMTVFSVVPALALAGYIWYSDVTIREKPRMLVVTFLLGVFFAGFAAIVNSAFMPLANAPVVGMALFFFLVVGPVEEFVKWLAVRFYAFRREEFDAVIDGAVYGAVAGLGFAFIENAIYISRVYLEAVSLGIQVLPATIGVTSVRSLAGPGHVIYSAFAGYYLGLAKFNPDDAGPIVVKGLLIATVLHGFYNTVVTYVPDLVPFNFLVFVVLYDGLLLFVLLRKLGRYRRAYEASLEVDADSDAA
jgi:RsiW-degrading membrane proteinase PrsW (M82 family)